MVGGEAVPSDGRFKGGQVLGPYVASGSYNLFAYQNMQRYRCGEQRINVVLRVCVCVWVQVQWAADKAMYMFIDC